jgi:predicted RNA-binding Zn ribbon-like protein
MTSSSPSRAPGPLETVRQFVNTVDLETSKDALQTPQALARWLREASLTDAAPQAVESDLRRALDLREALREAMAANHAGTPVPPDAAETINAAADRARLGLALAADSTWAAQPRAGGVDGALGALLAVVVQATADGSWRRLKVCANDACRWAFYDHSRARTGKWCSMQLCGNRAKQNAWRERQDQKSGSTTSPTRLA